MKNLFGLFFNRKKATGKEHRSHNLRAFTLNILSVLCVLDNFV
jgi:hypothetical protein